MKNIVISVRSGIVEVESQDSGTSVTIKDFDVLDESITEPDPVSGEDCLIEVFENQDDKPHGNEERS